jgi:hypothetical protein
MKTKKIVAIALLVLGGILVYFGINASEAPLEKITESITGRYSDETMYYLIGGALSLIVGLTLLLKK